MFDKLKVLAGKRSLREVAFVYLGALINGASLFCINIFLGRVLEQSLFGIFTLSILVLSTVAEMSDFGLNGGLLRFAPYYLANNEEEKLKQLVKTIWRWRVSLAIALTVFGIALSPLIASYVFNQPKIVYYIMFSFLGVGGVILLGFTSTYLQASQRFVSNSLFQVLKGTLRLALVVILYLSGINNLFVYLSVYIFIPWILFFISYRFLPHNFLKVSVDDEIKKQLHSQLARFSFWLVVWSLSAIVASRIDQIMVSNLMGLEQVAVYSMAFQFVYIYTIAQQSITTVLMPKMNGLKSVDEVRIFSKKVFQWLVPVVLMVGLLIYPSKYIIQFIFGYKYVESIPIYLVLSYSMLVNFSAIPFALIITAFNQTRIVAISGIVQMTLNILLNFVFIPRFGTVGAAYAFGLSSVFTFVVSFVCTNYLLRNKKIEVV